MDNPYRHCDVHERSLLGQYSELSGSGAITINQDTKNEDNLSNVIIFRKHCTKQYNDYLFHTMVLRYNGVSTLCI